MDEFIYSIIVEDFGSGQSWHSVQRTKEDAFLSMERGLKYMLKFYSSIGKRDIFAELVEFSGKEPRFWAKDLDSFAKGKRFLATNDICVYVNHMRIGEERIDCTL